MIEGIPEGLEVVRYGEVINPGEYTLIGPRQISSLGFGLVVKLSPGYIRSWDDKSSFWSFTRQFEKPIQITCELETELECGELDAAYQKIISNRKP